MLAGEEGADLVFKVHGEGCVSAQGKRVASEDGSEGYSDLYQENAMLQRESDTLRLRVKAMQETIDHLNTRVTHLLANEVSNLLIKSSTWTASCTVNSSHSCIHV